MPTNTAKRVGILATGSEITSGEILNTNGREIAQQLQAEGIVVGEHVVVDDQADNLKRAMQFLLLHHDAMITIGGLGPTSDDRTRFVLGDITAEPLVEHTHSWARIEARLTARNVRISRSNRQQALFPATAEIYTNTNGTADGCKWPLYQNKSIYLLPGPPKECLPLFETYIVPDLQASGFCSGNRLYRWRLTQVSESSVAELLEEQMADYQLNFAYRAAYPYLDIKLMLDPHAAETVEITAQIDGLLDKLGHDKNIKI